MRDAEDVRRIEGVNPNHMKEDCPNQNKCSNCLENYPTFSRTCNIYKREMEIPVVK